MNLDVFLKEGYKIYQESGNNNDLYYYIINYGKGLFREGAAIHCWDYFDSPFIEQQTKDMNYIERKKYCDELREESERLEEFIKYTKYNDDLERLVFDGYLYGKLNSLNIAILAIRPDGSKFYLDDGSDINYYMDSQYNMYEINHKTGKIVDADGNVWSLEDVEDSILPEIEYNGYTYSPRFDNKNVLIQSVPDQEIVDMKNDFAGISVEGIVKNAFKNSSCLFISSVNSLSFELKLLFIKSPSIWV